MAADNFTLTTCYTSWKTYQDHIRASLAPLTASQLELRAAPHLRSVGEQALHIVGARVYWFNAFLGEDTDPQMNVYAGWNEAALRLGAPVPTVAELVQAFDDTWRFMEHCLAHWSAAQMQQAFPDEWHGEPVDLTRAWVVWHVMEHDLHHGGELSLTLGMHDLPVDFPG